MFCYKCGAQMPDSNKFCPECGTAVTTAAQIHAPSPAVAKPKIKIRTSTKITIAFAGILLLSMLILPIANEEIGFRTRSYMLLDNYTELEGGAKLEGFFKSVFFITTALSALTVVFNINKKMNFAFLTSFIVFLSWLPILAMAFAADDASATLGTFVNCVCVVGLLLTNLICGMKKAEYN